MWRNLDMNKKESISLLNEVRKHQIDNKDYYNDDIDYMDFIELYVNHELKNYCNTVKEALETINELDQKDHIAMDISDDFYE